MSILSDKLLACHVHVTGNSAWSQWQLAPTLMPLQSLLSSIKRQGSFYELVICYKLWGSKSPSPLLLFLCQNYRGRIIRETEFRDPGFLGYHFFLVISMLRSRCYLLRFDFLHHSVCCVSHKVYTLSTHFTNSLYRLIIFAINHV